MKSSNAESDISIPMYQLETLATKVAETYNENNKNIIFFITSEMFPATQ